MDDNGEIRNCSGEHEKKRFLDILREGAFEAGDCGRASDEKPSWLDKEKLLRVKDIFEEHCAGILFGHFIGQSIMSQVPSLATVMLHTGNHSTRELATKRAVMTVGFVMGWYKGRVWDPQDPAHRSVCTVRAMHKTAQNKVSKLQPRKDEEGPWMSQYDMALTQFAFFGPLILYADRVGLYCSQEELDCLIHFWRYVAYLLGIKDEYNLGGLPYEDLVEVCRDIVRQVSVPNFCNPREDIVTICRMGSEGYSYLNRFIDYDSMHNLSSSILGISGVDKELDWRGYFNSWYFWLAFKLLRFQYLRQLTAPTYIRALEYKINRYLKARDSAEQQVQGDSVVRNYDVGTACPYSNSALSS